MINTTLCYIEHGDEYLMLHRVKKENDINRDKWIGLGGKFEKDESPEECLLREVSLVWLLGHGNYNTKTKKGGEK